jgi:PAS domain S-box-containing protein
MKLFKHPQVQEREIKTPQYEPNYQFTAQSLSSLLSASQAVNAVTDLEEALRLILFSARNLLQAHEGSVMLLDEEGFLRIVVSEGISPEVAQETRIAPGEGVSGKVFQSGQAMLIDVAPDQREFESFVHRDRPLRSAVSVPLKAVNRIVGVLNLNLTSGNRVFKEEDLRLAQLFGEQGAMAIHKGQLLDEARKRGVDLETLLEAGRGLMGVLELEPMLTRVLDASIKIATARAGFLSLLDEDAGRLSLGVYQGIARHDIRTVLSRAGFVDLFRPEAQTLIAIADNPVLHGLESHGDFAVALAMRAEARTKALLLLIGDEPGPDRLRLSETFAGQAGLAIRNSQLYQQVGDKEAQLASIVYSIENPVVVVDTDSRLVIANPAAEELFGFSADFQKGHQVAPLLREPELKALIQGETAGPLDVITGTTRPRTWKVKVSPVSMPDGTRGGRMLMMDDVTVERDTEKLKSDFVAVIGHELRTPLTLIKGFIRTLIRKGEAMSPDQRVEALTTADAQAERLRRLIEDLLYISRIEHSRPVLEVEEIDLVSVSEQLLKEFRAREPHREFALEAPDRAVLALDRTKTEQVLFHLLDNACKYSDETDPISVQMTEEPDRVVVAVVDKGMGILSEDLPRLFDRFHQVDLSSTREHGGTGVGLYICRALVDAHGGEIKAESAWGKGSTFRFWIPKGLSNVPQPGRPTRGSVPSSQGALGS